MDANIMKTQTFHKKKYDLTQGHTRSHMALLCLKIAFC